MVFGQDNVADFPASSKAVELFALLKVAIKQTDEARTLPQGGRATAHGVLLDALRIDLKNIVRTAQQIAIGQPGFADRFSMPSSLSYSGLLTAASRMMVELEKADVAAQFVGYELPETFVADLDADLKVIDESKDRQNSADMMGVAGTATLGAAIQLGLGIVEKLNAIMHNKYTRQPEKLRARESASHTERAAQREKTPTTPTNTTPPIINATPVVTTA